MADLFKVGKDVTLTREQKLMLRAFRGEWPCATDERRQEMMDEFNKMIRSTKKEESWRTQGSEVKTSSEEAAAAAAAMREGKSQEGEIDPLKGRSHALYLRGGELMVIVEIDKDAWADYGTFLTKYPDKTVFDIHPDKIAAAYMDQKAYDALLADGRALDQSEVNKCIQPLPKEIAPFELSLLEAFLCLEVDYDQRIKDLGYKGNDMGEYKSCGLFKDYFTGKIFEILHGKKEQTQNSGKGKGSGNNQKAKQGNGQKTNQGSGNSQKSNQGKGTGKGNGNGQPHQVKPGGKPGNKTGGGKGGTIRPGKHDQAAAAFLL